MFCSAPGFLKKALAAFDQGRGFEAGEGKELTISSDGIFNVYVIDTSGDTWPAAFY